jgi:uncharacterized protein YjbJ (UPF0337 family)
MHGSGFSKEGDKMGEFIDTAKGKVKEAAGDLTGNKELKRAGERDELKGVAGSNRSLLNSLKLLTFRQSRE